MCQSHRSEQFVEAFDEPVPQEENVEVIQLSSLSGATCEDSFSTLKDDPLVMQMLQAEANEFVSTGSEKSESRADSAHDTQNCCGQRYKFDQVVSDDGKEWSATFPRCLQDDGSAVDLAEVPDRVSAASAAPEVRLIPQKRISERTQIVDVPVPQTVDQPGDEICQDPADSIHRQSCRYACGVAATGPSSSRCVEDRESPARSSPAMLWRRL